MKQAKGNSRWMSRPALIVAALTLGVSAGARGSVTLSSNFLPPQMPYVSTDNVGFNAGAFVMDNLQMSSFSVQLAPPTLGNQITVNGVCSINLDLSISGGSYAPYVASAAYTMRFLHDSDIGSVAHFNTEMLALNISGGTLPAGMLIRESPTLASTGVTTITPVSGLYQIDSFFDVFTELSIDGGQNWLPGSGGSHLVVMPAPGAIWLLSLGLLGAGPRRRR